MTHCIYCHEPRNDKLSCCGENHWEDDALNVIKTYIDRLQGHDWSYSYSEDHSAYESGSKARESLLKLQKQIDQDFQIWNTIAPEPWRDGKY